MSEHSSIADFFARESRKLSSFVRRRLADAAEMEAEDLVQEVFTNLFEKADPLSEIGNLSAYVYRSLRNRIIDRLRSRKDTMSIDTRTLEGLSLSEILPHPDPSPLDGMEEMQRERAFAEAFEALPEQDRLLIEANEFEGRTYQELSEDWNIPMGTLMARKARAIKRLSAAMAEYSPRN